LDVLKRDVIVELPEGAIRDTMLLVCIVLPMYLIVNDFMTAPVGQFYSNKYAPWITPFAVPIIFFAYSWDVLFLTGHAFCLSFYVTYTICSQDEADFTGRRS
jgi:hypothetical protein